MTIVMFLFIILVASGLFFIASDVLKLPRLANRKSHAVCIKQPEGKGQRHGGHGEWLGSEAGTLCSHG